MEAEIRKTETKTEAVDSVINSENNYPLPIILYDSECPLCERFKLSL